MRASSPLHTFVVPSRASSGANRNRGDYARELNELGPSSSPLPGGSSEVEEVCENLAHLGERLRADVADRCGEPFNVDRVDVVALCHGNCFEPVA